MEAHKEKVFNVLFEDGNCQGAKKGVKGHRTRGGGLTTVLKIGGNGNF